MLSSGDKSDVAQASFLQGHQVICSEEENMAVDVSVSQSNTKISSHGLVRLLLQSHGEQ